MNKLKNIGISALAGSLISLSAAQAGGVSVSGSWELSYTNLNKDKTSGNKLGINKNITFGSGGDISDGGAVTWGTTVAMSDSAGLSSASVNINMGGIATLAYDSGTGGYGANAVDNIVPTAWEEIDYGLSTGITDVGAVSKSKGVVNLTVKAPTAGTGISFSYVGNVGGGHISDGATSGEVTGGRGIDLVLDIVDYSSPHFAYRLGFAGEMELKDTTCDDNPSGSSASCHAKYENNPYAGTAYTKIAIGPLHFGVQGTFKDPSEQAIGAIANKRVLLGGAALVIGDTLSISYGKGYEKIRYNDALRGTGYDQALGVTGQHQITHNANSLGDTGPNEYVNVRYHGVSAALNMGPVALKATKNHVDGAGENAASGPRNHSEINLSIAF